MTANTAESGPKKAPGLKSFHIFPSTSLRCKVRPVVVFSILDAYTRRPEGANRTIGTLLGYVSEGNILDITDAFPVVHKDSADGQVMMDQDYHRRMLNLKKKVSPKENVVGWYSCGPQQNPVLSSVLVHSFYCNPKESMFQPSSQLQSPVHFTVDVQLAADRQLPINPIKAYYHVETPIAQALAHFHEIPVDIYMPESDRAGFSYLLNQKKEAVEEKEGIEELDKSLVKMQEQFQKCQKYVEDVLNGVVQNPNTTTGRELSQLLRQTQPVFGPEFEELCSNRVQDTLMCVYLSNLARTQIALTEKINNSPMAK